MFFRSDIFGSYVSLFACIEKYFLSIETELDTFSYNSEWWFYFHHNPVNMGFLICTICICLRWYLKVVLHLINHEGWALFILSTYWLSIILFSMGECLFLYYHICEWTCWISCCWILGMLYRSWIPTLIWCSVQILSLIPRGIIALWLEFLFAM